MRAIHAKDTTPELIVRRAIHRMGYRYKLHEKSLPGHPDIVFPSRLKVIFVHGCFWHQHSEADCDDAHHPHSNAAYWVPKLALNTARDLDHSSRLEANGWQVLVIWDCETKSPEPLAARLRSFLGERDSQ